METTVTTEMYNLIILDESGSMSCVCRQTISGCNETINTIKAAQTQFADNQKHYVSIYAFQSSGNRPSRYLIKNQPIDEVKHITDKDYEPYGCTPLNDAVGMTLADLKATCASKPNAIGSVTIITDGMENSSTEYSTSQVAKMIEQLKEMGWSFNFIGANIDVQATAASYNIENSLSFMQDEEGTNGMWETERSSRMRYYNRVSNSNRNFAMFADRMSYEETMKQAAKGYFEKGSRVTPDRITQLEDDEIFVLGSNLQGMHRGGAARIAHTRFGAVMGQGVGLQGKSYAIPTMQGGVETIKPYVDEFIEFAKAHPELKFLVTRIGCGIAGFKDHEIAPLFKEAMDVENICLPQAFWDILNPLV